MTKRVERLLGGIILVCALFLNVVTADALKLTITKNEQKLGLRGSTGSPTADSFTGGYTLYKVSITNGTVRGVISIHNIGDEAETISGLSATIILTSDIVNNFTVTVEGNENLPEYGAGSDQIDWSVNNTINVGDTVSMAYVLTPNSTVDDEIKGSSIKVAKTVTITYPTSGGVQNINYTDACIPSIAIEDGAPETGIVSNILLFTGIIGASVGILVLSFKKNKFQNI